MSGRAGVNGQDAVCPVARAPGPDTDSVQMTHSTARCRFF